MPLTPRQIAEKLRDSGHHEAAIEVLFAALADGTTPARVATEAAADPVERGYATLAELKKMSVDEAETLRTEHPDVYAATLRNLDGTVPRQHLMEMSREDIEAFQRRDPKGHADSIAALLRGSDA